jgi:Patatin-like phospholipase
MDKPPQGPTSRNRVIDHSPRILSLDGGGIRGLSALLILKDVLDSARRISGNCGLLPCEHFDLIGGTSTGGLIAIMLGRLGMVTAQKFLSGPVDTVVD